VVGFFLVVGLLEVLDGSLVLLEFVVDNADEEENVGPFEDLSAIVNEQLLKREVRVLSFCQVLQLFLMQFIYLFSHFKQCDEGIFQISLCLCGGLL
jgi:hypothetical protein